MTYIYTDGPGRALEIRDDDGKAWLVTNTTAEIHVHRRDATTVARELCKAAGRDVVILDRPEGDPPDGIGYASHIPGGAVQMYLAGNYSLSRAREVAAHIAAAAADQAESDPDEEELARTVAEALDDARDGGTAPDYAIARAALAWMRDRETR